MQPIAQNFNLAAIVCEPAYDSSFALIGLGHKQVRPYKTLHHLLPHINILPLVKRAI